ncbi:hypothetical protein LCGC14_2367530, partial [marine sediment metagenome]
MSSRCPICRAENDDALRGGAGGYCACIDCGVEYLVAGGGESRPIVNDDLGREPSALLRWFMQRRCRYLRRLSPVDRPRLLDVGCGSGRFLARFRDYGPVAGVEISAPSRAYATDVLALEVFSSMD